MPSVHVHLSSYDGLFAFPRTGPALERFVQEQVAAYAALATSLGLRVRAPGS